MTPEQPKAWLERVLKKLSEPVFCAVTATELVQVMIDELPDEETPKRDGRPKRATCLTQDWILPQAWATWAKENGCSDPLKEADIFRDFWIAKQGADAAKKNWLATWRNWIRRGYDAPEPTSRPPSGDWTLKDWYEALTRNGSGYMRMSRTWPNMPGPNPWEYHNTEIPEDIRKAYTERWGWK